MDVKEVLNERLQNDYRAEQAKIAIKNRIYWLENGLLSPIFENERIDRKSQIKAYEDCLDILDKEFFELDLPEDRQFDIRIHEIKDRITDKICPVDDRTRCSRDYLINFKRAGEIAEIIEGLCYQMFNHGYNYNFENRWYKK